MKTYHAIFGEAISDSITQAVIKSQMTAEIRTHLELQSFSRTAELVSLMSSLSKIGTTTTCPKAAALGPVPMESGWVKNKEKGKGKGKSKGKGKEKPKSEKFEVWCDNCGTWSHKAANCFHGKEKQVHQIQGKAGTEGTDVGTKEIGLIEFVCEDTEMS